MANEVARRAYPDPPRCLTCKWWVDPPLQRPLEMLYGSCTRHPKWETTAEVHYCGEHRPKDDPIGNPQPD